MVNEVITVSNKAGFHMHLAGLFTAAMNNFQSTVIVRYHGREVDGKSIMSVMAACMKQGAEIEIECSGPDEIETLQAAVALVRKGAEGQGDT